MYEVETTCEKIIDSCVPLLSQHVRATEMEITGKCLGSLEWEEQASRKGPDTLPFSVLWQVRAQKLGEEGMHFALIGSKKLTVSLKQTVSIILPKRSHTSVSLLLLARR